MFKVILWQHSKFKASLGYMTSYLKNKSINLKVLCDSIRLPARTTVVLPSPGLLYVFPHLLVSHTSDHVLSRSPDPSLLVLARP